MLCQHQQKSNRIWHCPSRSADLGFLHEVHTGHTKSNKDDGEFLPSNIYCHPTFNAHEISFGQLGREGSLSLGTCVLHVLQVRMVGSPSGLAGQKILL